MSRAARRLRDILREEPVAWMVEAEPGRPLFDACGDPVDVMFFADQRDAQQAAIDEAGDLEPLRVVPLIRQPEEDES